MGANADTVRGVYEAFTTGDIPAVLAVLDDSVVWQEPVSLPLDDQTGPQAVAANIFGAIGRQISGFSGNADEIIDAGDVVFGIGTYRGTGRSNGVELSSDFVHVWRFGDNGKVTAFRTYSDTHLWRQALGVD